MHVPSDNKGAGIDPVSGTAIICNAMNTLQPESILQTLAKSGQSWHAADYFIAADTPLQVVTTFLRPDYYCLFLCLEGQLRGTVNGKSLDLAPFSLAAISPGAEIRVEQVSPHCKGRFLFFTRGFLLENNISPSLVEALHFLEGQIGYCVHLQRRTADVLLKLYDILLKKRQDKETSYHREIIRTLFFTYVYEAAALFRSNGGFRKPGTGRHDELFQKFSALLFQHDKTEHHLKFYADALFITPQYLIHAIKHACGRTPGALIDEALIAEAKLLLSHKVLSLAGIAEQLRFSEQAAFSKFFKKHTGSSPSAYRAALDSEITGREPATS